MGEIAGVRARSRHHFRVAREHGVELRHQGLDLGRETAIDGGAAAFAHRRQAIAQARQRTQSDAHLHQRRHRQPGGEQRERDRKQAVETRHRFDDQRRIRGHDHAQCEFGLLGGAQHLLDHAQRRAVRPFGGVRVHFAVCRAVAGHRQHHVPQRTRAQQPLSPPTLCSLVARLGRARAGRARIREHVDLPVQPGIRTREARVAERRAQGRLAIGVHGEIGRELIQMGDELGLELTLDVLGEHAPERPAGDEHGQQHPHQRAREQAQAQRSLPTRHGGIHCGHVRR